MEAPASPFLEIASARSNNIRILYGFLVVFVTVILFMLPVTEAVYDFRTDLREDEFTSPTGVDVNSANVTLGEAVYDNDTGTIDYASDLYTDVPVYSSYNATSRQLLVAGLTDNTTRVLSISYDVDALTGNDAIKAFLDQMPWIWILIIIIFPVAAIAAIFTGRAD